MSFNIIIIAITIIISNALDWTWTIINLIKKRD